jgi:hypothetical protein
LPLSASEKFAEFSFANNIEDLLKRRENEGIDLLTSYELEALEYYDRTMKEQEGNDFRNGKPQQTQRQLHSQSSSRSSGSSLSQYLTDLGLSGGSHWHTSLSSPQEEGEVEEDGDSSDVEGEEMDPTIAAIRAAQSLMKRTTSLLKEDDQDERRKYAEEIMERLEMERIEAARQIMERIEHEIETQGSLTGDETWDDNESRVDDPYEVMNEKGEVAEMKPSEQETESSEKDSTKEEVAEMKPSEQETESSEKDSAKKGEEDCQPELTKNHVLDEAQKNLPSSLSSPPPSFSSVTTVVTTASVEDAEETEHSS